MPIKNTYSLTHVFPMIVAWVILIPISIICVRRREKWKWWFKVHILFVSIALVLTIIGTVYGIHAVDSKPKVTHFSSHHHIIGTLAIILVLVQSILGVYIHFTYNPSRQRVPKRDISHSWLGRLTLLTALAATISGYVYVTMDIWVWFLTGIMFMIFYVQFAIK